MNHFTCPGYNNAATMTTATFTGNVEQSQVSIRFSDKFGTGHPRIIPFVLTNGDGDVYGTVENTLNFYKILRHLRLRPLF